MNLKKIHYTSAFFLFIFICLHLWNHSFGILGGSAHVQIMSQLRVLYRNAIFESILILSVVVQIYTGFRLFFRKRKNQKTFYEKIQNWSGLYLSFFFLNHLGAVFVGRWVLDLDTNFFFGIAGLNLFPWNLFFIPYYFLAIVSFFGHLASIHNQKMQKYVLGVSPLTQTHFILGIGILFSFYIIFGFTNQFQGYEIPLEYQFLMGR
ncbi:MAG: hypothetical protein O9301_01710 [Leptospira sp.]|nr:hypothetical protein [Leptospira sp.]